MPHDLAPLRPPFDEGTAATLDRWMPPGTDGAIEPLALFRLLARNDALAAVMRPLGAHQLSRRSALGLRTRELVIDRTCARLGCSYEWGVHAVAFGEAAGLGEADVAATAAPLDAHPWAPDDRAVLALVDALVDTGTAPPDLLDELGARFDAPALLELLVLCGWYHLIAFVANAAALPDEPWARPLPTPDRVG